MKCLKCGSENFNNNNFCEYCGANLKEMPQTANSSEPAVVFTDGNGKVIPEKPDEDSAGKIVGIVVGAIGGTVLLFILAGLAVLAIGIAFLGACFAALGG